MRYFYVFLFLSFLLSTVSCSDKPVYKQGKTVFKLGDEQEWASKHLNTAEWKRRLKFVPDGKVFWSRTNVQILESPESLKSYGVRLEIYGEYELFWDGVLIGRNGNPGQEALLEPEGELWTSFYIPNSLTEKGEHVMALRLSNYYYPDHIGVYDLEVDYYQELLTDRLIQNSYMHVFAGVFLIASIYFLFLFMGNKKEHSMLIFSICCFLFFGLTMTHFVRTTLPIHYSLHVIRLEVITGLMFGISFLIPLYFSIQFPFPRRKLFFGVYAAILLYIFVIKHHHFNFTMLVMSIGLWLFSSCIAIFGIYKKVKGALLLFLTLFLCLIIGYIVSFNIGLFTCFSLILLNMLYLLSIRIKEQRLAYEESLIQSTRLRLELLKKNIQPHFLMNTLTSLIDWIEESPKKGVQFIEALAKEFDLFNQIENKKLIPITQEIALCRSHIEIMKYRKEIDYLWLEEGIQPDEMIPPGIFHTLLENGITHSLPMEGNIIEFKLIFELRQDYKYYTFLTFAKLVKEGVNKKEGTGSKYVKARLMESYSNKWEFTSEPTNNGWKNTIKIYS
ncbi:histidine kinase [Tenacibaculum xiamenense]|uniref:histidine kinase n=1 Tax=Tenacibaculum xiamenense TaxID=1261553 RepID=UPI0038964E1E